MTTNASGNVSAREALESYLSGLWQQALDLDGIGVDDDFFELGGDSLAAMQIAAQLADRFQMEVTEVMAFEQPTIRQLADTVERALEQRAARIAGQAASEGETAAAQRVG